MADDNLINDLSRVPNIIGSLGLAIAEAQKQFNLDYVNSLNSLVVMASKLTGEKASAGPEADTLQKLLLNLAPPRYQFTETELAVKLDLAQSAQLSGSAGLGFGFAGVVVNAAFSLGYATDYRAAAECRATIHAELPGDNQALFTSLLEQARTIDGTPLQFPDKSVLDKSILDAASSLLAKLTGGNAKPSA